MVRPPDYKDQYADTEEYEPSNEEHQHTNGNVKVRHRNGQLRPPVDEVVPPLDAFDLADLLREEFEPLQWIIPDYLPEGLTLLFSRPKIGKSMLALALSLRTARRVSGGVDGTVLYLTLDDTSKRRLQSRTRSLLQGAEIEGSRVWGVTQSEKLDSGLIMQLSMWMRGHTDTRLIVIDVYARIKPKKQNDDVYASDYNALVLLQEFAVKHHLAIILVHHTNKKADTEDWIDGINGSTGLAGAVDTIWRLVRARGSTDIKLQVTGRDVIDCEVALSLQDLDAPWTLIGEEENLSATEQQILTLLQSGEEWTPKKVAEATGLKHSTVLGTLRRMMQKNLVMQTTYGNYRITELHTEKPCNSVILVIPPEKEAQAYNDWQARVQANMRKLDDANYIPSPEETKRILAEWNIVHTKGGLQA